MILGNYLYLDPCNANGVFHLLAMSSLLNRLSCEAAHHEIIHYLNVGQLNLPAMRWMPVLFFIHSLMVICCMRVLFNALMHVELQRISR